MDAAAASRRAKPNRGRPLVPPNYVSLRVLQELRQRENEERRRREEEEAAARRAREEQRKRQEEEEAAARRFVEERRRREEEAAAARRARDAAAAAAASRPETRTSSSSHTSSSSFRYSERDRGGQRLVVVADRPPPPPRRAECAPGKIEGATGGCRGNKGLDGVAANAPIGGGFKAQNVGKGKVSAGVLAGPGVPDKPATASCHAGKPEEKRNGEASGCQGTTSETSSASGELAKLDIASYRGPARQRNRYQGKKGWDGRSTETTMSSSNCEVVEASPLPVVNMENKGKKSRSGDQSRETASASMPGKSPPQGVRSDNKGKNKPSGGRQAGAAPGSDLPDGKKVESSGCEDNASVVSSVPGEQTDADGASHRMPLKPMYKPKGKKRLDGRNTETTTTIVAGKVTDASPLEGVSLEIKGIKGLTEQGTETALARMRIEAADASLARVLLSENKGPSGGRHAGMAGMNAQPCPATEGSRRHRSSSTWEAKTDGLQAKQTVVEVKVQPNLSAESSSYLKNSGDQGTTKEVKSEGSEEKQRVVDMRTAAQLKPRDMRNSGRPRPGSYSRANVAARQHDMIWVPKGASVPDSEY